MLFICFQSHSSFGFFWFPPVDRGRTPFSDIRSSIWYPQRGRICVKPSVSFIFPAPTFNFSNAVDSERCFPSKRVFLSYTSLMPFSTTGSAGWPSCQKTPGVWVCWHVGSFEKREAFRFRKSACTAKGYAATIVGFFSALNHVFLQPNSLPRLVF